MQKRWLQLFELPKTRDFTIISRRALHKIPIPRDFYEKECLKNEINSQKASDGVGPDEK